MHHLLWHGPTVYNGDLRGPKTLTPIAEPRFPACKAYALPLRDRGLCRMLYAINALVHFTCNTCFECAYIKLISKKGRHSEKTKVSGKKDLKK